MSKSMKTKKQAGPSNMEGSSEARRIAAAIMEVLAGVETTGTAAAALGISLTRYYILEQRALQGLVSACESRRGRRASPQKRIVEMESEVERLKHECRRLHALLRVSRRTIGLPADSKTSGKGSKKRKTRPKARALKMASMLRQPEGEEPEGKETA